VSSLQPVKHDFQRFAREILGFELTPAQVKMADAITQAYESGDNIVIGGWARPGRTSVMRVVKGAIEEQHK
jgi:hypothetical protein